MLETNYNFVLIVFSGIYSGCSRFIRWTTCLSYIPGILFFILNIFYILLLVLFLFFGFVFGFVLLVCKCYEQVAIVTGGSPKSATFNSPNGMFAQDQTKNKKQKKTELSINQ